MERVTEAASERPTERGRGAARLHGPCTSCTSGRRDGAAWADGSSGTRSGAAPRCRAAPAACLGGTSRSSSWERPQRRRSIPTDGQPEPREQAEDDLLAFSAFPAPHWSKLRSTNPLERVNHEIGRRTDVVGILPNDRPAIRLAGALLIEQNDEWLVGRRYLSVESLALVLVNEDEREPQREEVRALQPA